MATTFGEFLREERRKRSWSLKELGERLRSTRTAGSVSPQYLNDLEHDRRSPSDELLQQFAKLFDARLETLQALAQRSLTAVSEYLADYSSTSPEVGRVFRRASDVGFTDWSKVEEFIQRASKGKRRRK